MIKKLKIGLLIVALAFFAGVGFANAADLSWTADTTIDLSSPDVNLTIASGSKATSLVVGTGSIDIVVPNGNSFTITSASRDLTVSGVTTADVAQSCSAAFLKTVTVYGGTGGETITLSAYSSECTPDSSGGGGGGGGGGSTKTTTPATTTPAATTPVTTTPATTTPASTVAAPSAYNFGTTVLKNGSQGEAVKELQRFLNVKLNLGLAVDGKLGPKTIAVIKTWQKDNGLVADGLIGPKTKTMMNASVSATPATPAVPASAYNLGTAVLKNGSRGEAVKELQRFLNAKLNLGLTVDGALGPKTITVIKQWQTDNGLVADGLIGPATKAKMNTSVSQ